MNIDRLRLVVVALAVYRVSHMIVMESGPFKVFGRWRKWLIAWDAAGNPDGLPEKSHWLVEGIMCVFCVSFWLALPAAVAVLWPRKSTDLVALWLALSAATLILRKRYQ